MFSAYHTFPLQVQYEANLQKRKVTMHEYIEAMEKMKTSGLDITVLILCKMLDLSCVLLIEDSMWKSTDIPIEQFDIYLLMFKSGRFVSATRNDGGKILVSVPKCAENVIDEHRDPSTYKPAVVTHYSGNDGDADSVAVNSSQLNNTDTMISTVDAFSGK